MNSSFENEILEIVDSNDNVIGKATRGEIHRQRLFHRAVHVFIFNPAGQIYIRRRSRSNDPHAGKLDSSVAGHVSPGETYEEAAVRELREQLGVKTGLKEMLRVPASELTDNEYVVLFGAVTEIEPIPNPRAVQWGTFMSREEVAKLIDEFPDDFVPTFIILWRLFAR
jgi:isopentenyl-diphosphate delta-isomerase